MINVRAEKFTGFVFLLLCFLGTVSAQEQLEDFNRNMDIAYSYQNINSDSILAHAGSAYSIALNLQNPDLKIDALKLIIKAQLINGNNSTAMLNCLKADSIIAINRLSDRLPEILMCKGLIYQNSGFTSEGLQLLFQSKGLIEKLNNEIIESELNYYIALASYEIGENEQSRKYLKEAMVSRLNDKDYTSLMNYYMLMASTFTSVDSISKYLQLADEISKLKKMDYKKAILLNNKALFYKATRNLTLAKTYYLEAISISVTNGYLKHLSNLYNNFAYLLMAEAKYDSALLVLDKALSISRDLNNIDIEASVLDSYSDYYVAVNDSAKALINYKESVKLKNEYRKKQQIEKSLFLSTVFETEKKEKEIARQDSELYRIYFFLFAAVSLFAVALVILVYFRHKSAIRKARIKTMDREKKLEVANAMIEGQDTERKRIAMDLHDGISPKLGSLRLMIDSHFEESDVYSEVSDSINDLDHNIREISHRMLPSQLESKGLIVALTRFINLLNQNNKATIKFYTTVENRLEEKYELNIYFLFYELINNALKHSGATEIIAQLLDGNKVMSLSVEDNGKGFDPEKEYTGIGLRNIRQRVTYLNGELEIDSVVGEGTAVMIEIVI